MNKLINGYRYIEVPKGSYDFEITRLRTHCTLDFKEKNKKAKDGYITHFWNNVIEYDVLDKCEIVGKKLSEDEWKEIVEHHYEYGGSKSRGILIAKDYISGRALFTATESGLSLLKSLNLLDKYERGELLILKEKQ